MACPNGHIFTVSMSDSDLVLDCEIRDWESFSLLPQTTQRRLSGKVSNELQPLRGGLRRLASWCGHETGGGIKRPAILQTLHRDRGRREAGQDCVAVKRVVRREMVGEVYNDLGLQSIRESVFARALFTSLKLRGYVREDGNIKKRPEKPEYPTNSYAMEFVDLHEPFDRIGAVNVDTNKADENTLAILYSTTLSQAGANYLDKLSFA